jgi:hypothetical protein
MDTTTPSAACPMQAVVAPAALRPLLAVLRPSSPTPARSRALQQSRCAALPVHRCSSGCVHARIVHAADDATRDHVAAVCVMLLQILPMHSVSHQLQSPGHWRAAAGAACAAARLGSLGADALVVTICSWTDTVNSQPQRQHPQQVGLYPAFQICSCSKAYDQVVVMPCCACSPCLQGCLTDMVQHSC